MLTRSELPENPVVLAVRDHDGRQHRIQTERVRGGNVRMTCTCDANRSDGWCAHQVQLLCMRYDTVVERSEDAEYHFEDVVMGTALADLADDVDLAMGDYEKALDAMGLKRPAGLEPVKLQRVAELASDLAEAASHLEGALGRFKKKLAAGSA
jgi:hypothetical protein